MAAKKQPGVWVIKQGIMKLIRVTDLKLAQEAGFKVYEKPFVPIPAVNTDKPTITLIKKPDTAEPVKAAEKPKAEIVISYGKAKGKGRKKHTEHTEALGK